MKRKQKETTKAKTCDDCTAYKPLTKNSPKRKCTRPNSPVFECEIGRATAKRQAMCSSVGPDRFIGEVPQTIEEED